MFSQTEIKGKLVNCRGCKVTAITDESSFEPKKTFYTSKPDRFGNFVFELKELYRPSTVIVEVNSTKIPVYVEPNEQTWITVQQDAYGLNYYFERNLVAENNHLKEYFEQFGWLSNREKDSHGAEASFVNIPNSIYASFRSAADSSKVNYLVNLREEMMQFTSPNQSFSAAYQDFISTYANHASSSYIYALASEIPINDADKNLITSTLGTHQFQDSDEVNPGFMPHLNAYINYIAANENQRVDQFLDYFNFIWRQANQLHPSLRNDYLLYLLDKELQPANLQALKPTIHQFIQSLSSIDDIAVVTSIYEDVKRRADGRKAPNFVLEDKKGNLISLASFEGQSVFLAFWSSSCRPCIEGMKKSKENKRYLRNEPVKFVYISTDLTRSTWKSNQYVQQAGKNDVHLWIGKSQPELKEYDAFTLPTYYFINPKGEFIFEFPKSWEAEFVNFVKQF